MPMLSEEIAGRVKEELVNLAGPVQLVMFTQDSECEYCAETQQLVEEVAQLSDQLTSRVYDLIVDTEEAEAFGVDKAPAIAVVGAEDYGVKFYGIPSGYEFATFLEAIRTVATGEPELSEDTLATLEEITEPVHMQVFVTPTCSYCPSAAVLAHNMAVASPMVRADVVEAMEFPNLARQYQVMGVPRTVLNEHVHIEGAAPEATVLEKLQEALVGVKEQA